MARRHRKKRNQGEVELNLAAMLDMAFQLLTFFILTFRPAPAEGQIMLRMPPPMPVTVVKGGQTAGNNASNPNPVSGLNTLVISVYANKITGDISTMGLGLANSDSQLQLGPNLKKLNEELKKLFGNPTAPFDQVLVQVDSNLQYGPLMKVVEVCTAQKLATGARLSKLSFVEILESASTPSAPAGAAAPQ